MVFSILYTACFLWMCVEAIPETTHLIQTDPEGNVVHLDVTFDMDKKIVMAAVGDVSKYKGGVPTINLHDYNTGYGVLKDINRMTCILAQPLVPMATAEKYRIGVTNEVHEHTLKVNETQMDYEDVLNMAGPTIAVFCKDYAVFFAIATPVHRHKRGAFEDANAVAKDIAVADAIAHEKSWCVFSSCKK